MSVLLRPKIEAPGSLFYSKEYLTRTTAARTPGLTLRVDHVKAWSLGGETTEENLQTLCEECNLGNSNAL